MIVDRLEGGAGPESRLKWISRSYAELKTKEDKEDSPSKTK